MENEINPFQEEQIPIVDEIKAELERLEHQKRYLESLLEYYEPTSDILTNL